MRVFKPLAVSALLVTLCVLPKLTAEEQLALPGRTATARQPATPVAQTFPWETGDEYFVRQKLAMTAPEIEFDDVSLEQCFDYIRELCEVNVFVNWAAIETAAVSRDRTITLQLRAGSVRLKKLLELILEEAGAGETDLDYEIRGSVIHVSTKEDLARSTLIVIYDVRDLMGYTSVHTLYGESTYVCGDIERLAYIVEAMVDPESWRTTGGNVGTIVNYGEMLIITQTRFAHEQIWSMLKSMREGWKQERF